MVGLNISPYKPNTRLIQTHYTLISDKGQAGLASFGTLNLGLGSFGLSRTVFFPHFALRFELCCTKYFTGTSRELLFPLPTKKIFCWDILCVAYGKPSQYRCSPCLRNASMHSTSIACVHRITKQSS